MPVAAGRMAREKHVWTSARYWDKGAAVRTSVFVAPATVSGGLSFVLAIAAIAVAVAYVAVAPPMVDQAAPAAANLESSLVTARSTQLEAPIAAAAADGPSRGPLRVYLVQPVPYENGLPVFRGYVRNDHASNLLTLRMEAAATYPIVAVLAPGEQVSFEFRGTHADLSTRPTFFFSMRR